MESLDYLELAAQFKKTIACLRGPGGCPWDQKQTFESLQKYMTEEASEAIEASAKLSKSAPHLISEAAQEFCEELGDVLLQVYLNAQIAEELKLFSISDVFKSINEKMIRRHPHVFSEESRSMSAEEVEKNWELIKKQEREARAQALKK